MKICLSCGQGSKGDGVYCCGCGRTFGAKICAEKHSNAPSPQVRCCATCGSTDLTEPTRYVSLRWAPPLLAGLAALLLWRWGVAHLVLLGSLFWRGVLTILALLLDTTPCGVVRGAYRALAWLFVLWLLGWMLAPSPGGGNGLGRWLRALPTAVLRTAFGGARPLLRLLGRFLYLAVWPARRRPAAGHPKDPQH